MKKEAQSLHHQQPRSKDCGGAIDTWQSSGANRRSFRFFHIFPHLSIIFSKVKKKSFPHEQFRLPLSPVCMEAIWSGTVSHMGI